MKRKDPQSKLCSQRDCFYITAKRLKYLNFKSSILNIKLLPLLFAISTVACLAEGFFVTTFRIPSPVRFLSNSLTFYAVKRIFDFPQKFTQNVFHCVFIKVSFLVVILYPDSEMKINFSQNFLKKKLATIKYCKKRFKHLHYFLH